MMKTTFKTSDPLLDALWERAVGSVSADFNRTELDGRQVMLGPPWLRDHVHELKGYKYIGEDLKSGLEFFFRHQFEDGQYPDFFVPVGDQHAGFVTEPFKRVDAGQDRVFIRVPVEADLEYLAVEGVYQAFIASGDADWLASQMATLEKGLEYLTTDRYRWSSEHQLVVRPHTTDTWDYTFFYDDDHELTNREIRRLDDSVPLCIFHGDNSGLYSACRMMGFFCRKLGRTQEEQRWNEFGEGVRQRANALLWGSGFYIHQYHLDEQLRGRYNEEERLSLSNAYDVNRGFTSHQQAVEIVRSFRDRWLANRDTYFSEWFTIEPPYPHKIAFFEPCEYTNGGLFALTGAELAKAALNHGCEGYGVDILRRYEQFMSGRKGAGFMFFVDGRGYGGGPEGWTGAAFMSALMEGLAGVKDTASTLSQVTLSPKWAAAGVTSAEITACYPASGRCVGYSYSQTPDAIEMTLSGDAQALSVRVLLPERTVCNWSEFGGRQVQAAAQHVEASNYVSVVLPEPEGTLTLRLSG